MLVYNTDMKSHANPNLQKLQKSPHFTDNIEHAQPHDHMTFKDLREGPVDIEMGGVRLQVIKPERDMIEGKQDQWSSFNPAIPYYLVDPAGLDFENDKGYKALRDDESIILGREDEFKGRFDFTDAVSRKQVQIERSGDYLYVEDLGSTNGTYIGRSVLRSFGVNEPLAREKPEQAKRERFNPPVVAEHEKGERLSVKMQVYSIANEHHPERNEDNKFIDTLAGSAGVFDGVGGHFGSEIASAVAAKSVQESLQDAPQTLSVKDGQNLVESALRKARADIVAEATDGRQISTTATIAKVLKNEQGNPYVAIASIADSRAYLLRNNKLSMLTLDESLAIAMAGTEKEKIARQEKFANVTDISQLNKEEYSAYRRRNQILSLLGSGKNDELEEVQTTFVDIEPGDKILLTSDGVHDNLTTSEIQAIMTSSAGHKASELASAAQQRSREDHLRAKPDDMTAAILSFENN